MGYYQDLSCCAEFDKTYEFLRAVGWLDRDHPFETGAVDPAIYHKLIEFKNNPWQPFLACGYHECEICLYTGEMHGVNNLFIPGNGVVYTCPEMIVHYMNAHHYRPPDVFCEAVINCPPMRTVPYFKALLAAGARPLISKRKGDQ